MASWSDDLITGWRELALNFNPPLCWVSMLPEASQFISLSQSPRLWNGTSKDGVSMGILRIHYFKYMRCCITGKYHWLYYQKKKRKHCSCISEKCQHTYVSLGTFMCSCEYQDRKKDRWSNRLMLHSVGWMCNHMWYTQVRSRQQEKMNTRK